MEVLREGYRIPFQRAPTLSREPILFPAYCPNSIRGKALVQEVASLLRKGAIKPAPLPSPGFYSGLFVTLKASGSWRPIIKPLSLEPHGVENTIQDGNASVHPSVCPQGGLDGLCRPLGCVSADSSPSGIPEVSSVRGIREGIPIQDFVLV